MVVDHCLLTWLFAIDADIIAAGEILHHAFFFRVIYVLFSVVIEQVPFCLGFNRATWTFVRSLLAVRIMHVLKVIAPRPKTFVAFNAHEALFFVFIYVVHTHRIRLLVVAVVTALWTIYVSTDLFIPFYVLGEARSRV